MAPAFGYPMVLPKDDRAPKVDAVQAKIDKMGPKEIAGLPDLDDGDFKIIGMLIQQLCFMDFNLRRALLLTSRVTRDTRLRKPVSVTYRTRSPTCRNGNRKMTSRD